MQIEGIKLRRLTPPKDSLRDALRAAKLRLREGDIVAISSKVVSIDEGACVPIDSIEKRKLIEQEADWYYRTPHSRYRSVFTIAKGYMPGAAGIDESNGNGYYILYPKDPFKSAKRWRTWLRKEYRVDKLGVVITDSTSLPLRRGAIGFALSWDGLDPLRDYRGTKDIFGRTIQAEVANLVDALATAAVLEMGEGGEQTPVAVIRNARNIVLKNVPHTKEPLIVSPEDDSSPPCSGGAGGRKEEAGRASAPSFRLTQRSHLYIQGHSRRARPRACV